MKHDSTGTLPLHLFSSVALYANHLLSNQSVTLLSPYVNTANRFDPQQGAPSDQTITVATTIILLSKNFIVFLKLSQHLKSIGPINLPKVTKKFLFPFICNIAQFNCLGYTDHA